ncbi:tetraprenyl-beta-curcumene synthase family protein [Alicyclobacillus sendaiensis]|uniref:Tetraprenyl-beta-curcumene synthase family protein n=1 Tax=Alicyclobacillus sendaiensis PA2 TaxID=3029425 RepID=A0ABT6XYP4_ALISE|nr:tetraprenyl-beta-curcumene synthase family protein [Alicyclobacillus sendaiensis]MDI9260204.1 tetraprenyl-beta-curcumene synthase family protein [Alicyclobacillus sendaiensis PA2]
MPQGSKLGQSQFLYRLFRRVMPLVRAELAQWRARAESIPDELLREQALASLRDKQFHADGGAVYAAGNPNHMPHLVQAIVSLQTISDYLDNLCDRAGVCDPKAFQTLHQSLQDAVHPGTPPSDYYRHYGHREDGGYLESLVRSCQRALEQLPHYRAVESQVDWYARRYSELQEHKHAPVGERESRLLNWSRQHLAAYPGVAWHEWAAATGSTLGMFALFLAATEPIARADVHRLHQMYFPYLCGLHILLDYWIDAIEDAAHGDFNFVACYRDPASAWARIEQFAAESVERTADLPGGVIHRYVVHGLMGMYLSDPKTRSAAHLAASRRRIYRFGVTPILFYCATQLYRRLA